MPIIIENLSYTYNPKAAFKKDALRDISFRVEDGEFFGIIGHTGSGKSTLIGHLNGLVKLSAGKITVDDIDLGKKYDYKKLRSKVGMLFQYPEHQLFDESVRRDVGFGCRNLGVSAEETEERVKNAITLVGLDYDKIAERSPFELSGGQMRRVALAGVLAMRPSVLVLDEPTAGLDPRGKKQILSLVHSVRKECPTVIMISHNMDEIFENCDRIALLDKGRLRGVFTPAELYKNSDLVRECGLEMPTAFNLADRLNSRGYSISNLQSESDLLSQIAEQYRAKHGGASTSCSAAITKANSNITTNAATDTTTTNTNANDTKTGNTNAGSSANSITESSNRKNYSTGSFDNTRNSTNISNSNANINNVDNSKTSNSASAQDTNKNANGGGN